MRIVNSLVEDFGGFELDAGAVDLRSASTQGILLPYHGKVPEQMASASSVFLQVNVHPIQGARFVLVAKQSGKEVRRPAEASNDEVIALVDRFFFTGKGETNPDSGLTDYWLGSAQESYMTWRGIARNYRQLLKPLMALNEDQRKYIVKRLLE